MGTQYIKNKLDKSFGAVGMSAGMLLLVAGTVIVFFSLTGILLFAIGALVGFTFTATLVDLKNRRMKFATYLFGIIPVGQWVAIKAGMVLDVRDWKTLWRSYSAGNRTLDLEERDFRIILFDNQGKAIMPVKKFKDKESAVAAAAEMSSAMGIGVGRLNNG